MSKGAASGQRALALAARSASALLGRLPVDQSLAFAAAAGRFYARCGGPRTQVARLNLGYAFKDWTRERRERVLQDSFANLGRSIAEFALLQGPAREALLARVEIEGIEHYEAARRGSESGGVLLMTAHFGNWELAGAALAQRGHEVSVVHHALDDPYLDAMVARSRQRSGFETLKLGKAWLGLVRALRRGRIVVLLMDQNADRTEGVFAPFFSRLASTRVGAVRMAQTREVALLPAFAFRRADGRSHIVRFYPALELEPDGDDPDAALMRNVTRMNRVIEQAIETAPDHWMWLHKRWKTRPESEPERLYPRRRSGWRR